MTPVRKLAKEIIRSMDEEPETWNISGDDLCHNGIMNVDLQSMLISVTAPVEVAFGVIDTIRIWRAVNRYKARKINDTIQSIKIYKKTGALQDKMAAGTPPKIGKDMLTFNNIRERFAPNISDDRYLIWANQKPSYIEWHFKGRDFDSHIPVNELRVEQYILETNQNPEKQ